MKKKFFFLLLATVPFLFAGCSKKNYTPKSSPLTSSDINAILSSLGSQMVNGLAFTSDNSSPRAASLLKSTMSDTTTDSTGSGNFTMPGPDGGNLSISLDYDIDTIISNDTIINDTVWPSFPQIIDGRVKMTYTYNDFVYTYNNMQITQNGSLLWIIDYYANGAMGYQKFTAAVTGNVHDIISNGDGGNFATDMTYTFTINTDSNGWVETATGTVNGKSYNETFHGT